MSGSKVNAVFYAGSYHPIQAGSIDGTDILPHDNAVYRAQLCSSAGLYEPFEIPRSSETLIAPSLLAASLIPPRKTLSAR
ncbi:hypothetical protein SLA2020_339140 [Shorea laevis]